MPRPILRPPADTRQQLLTNGTILLSERGFSAVGIERILRETGVPKGSFYHYFDSKEHFALAVLDHYQQAFRRRLNSTLAARVDPDDPASEALTFDVRLARFVQAGMDGLERHGWRRGCLVAALAIEIESLSPDFRSRLEAVLNEWEQTTAVVLQEAGFARAQAESLSVLFWQAWEGAVLRARLQRSGTPLQAFADHFLRCLAHPP